MIDSCVTCCISFVTAIGSLICAMPHMRHHSGAMPHCYVTPPVSHHLCHTTNVTPPMSHHLGHTSGSKGGMADAQDKRQEVIDWCKTRGHRLTRHTGHRLTRHTGHRLLQPGLHWQLGPCLCLSCRCFLLLLYIPREHVGRVRARCVFIYMCICVFISIYTYVCMNT